MGHSSSEEEQIAALKAFWEDYGNIILTIALIASVLFAVWRYWHVHHSKQRDELSLHFEQVMMDYQRSQGKSDPALNTSLQSDAQKTISLAPDSTYANMTRWVLARVAMDHSDLKEAAAQLNGVLAHDPSDDIRALTHMRLAQVETASGQPQAALAQLTLVKNPAYTPSRYELEGDAWMMAHKPDQATSAYLKARDYLVANKLPERPLLNMKMADLGIAPVEKPVSVTSTGAGVPAS